MQPWNKCTEIMIISYRVEGADGGQWSLPGLFLDVFYS